jgi:hypothetical protein
MGLGTLVGRGFVRIDADTKPAEKAIKALGAIGSLGALGALGGAIAPITTATLGLAGAFATAGGAATAFGAAVVPQFQAITKATQQKSTADDQQSKAQLAVAAAQKLAKEGGFKYGQQVQITSKMSAQAKAQAQEYNRALASAQTATKGAAKSQALYKEKLDAMPPATKETALALEKLKDAGKKWSDTLAANTMPIFTKGIQFLQGLLPRLTPMVQSVAGEITFFLDTLGESSAGRIFKEFGRNVTKNGSGALGSFLRIATNVLAGVIGLLNAFMPASKGVTGGLEQMTKKFADWSAGLGKSKSFQDFLSRMREEIPKLFTALGQLISVFGKLTVAAGPFAGLSLRIAEAMARLLDSIPMPVLRVLVPTILAVNVAMKAWAIATAINTAVQTVHTAVVRAGGLSTIAMTVAMRAARIAILAWSAATRIAALAWRLLSLAFTASPIGLVITAIIALGVALVIAYNKSATFRRIVQAAFGGVLMVGKAIGHWFAHDFVNFFTQTIPHAFQVTRDWVARNWPWILGALTGPIGLAVVWIIKHWDSVKNFFVSAWGVIKRNSIDPLVHFFTVVIPNAGRSMRDAIMGFVRRMALAVLDSFGMIIKGAAKLFGWVPGVGGHLKSAVRAFNKFRDDVNKALGGIKDRHPTIAVGMKIATGKNAGLVNIGGIARATGGPIYGPGTETSDSVPVMASKNEHMWTAKEVRAAGGHGAVIALRQAVLSGGMGRFASGGAVGVRTSAPSGRQINSGTNSAFANFMKANVWTLIKAFKEMLAAQAGPSFIGLGGKVGASAAAAMRYAQNLLGAHIYGWTSAQWPAWRSLGMGESGWRWNALNKSSGAYGIPQALPAGKMASAGADWRTNPATQVRWMASYIHSVYGTPSRAWSTWQHRSPHWYDQGGWLMPGATMAYNGTGRPERILPPGQSGGGVTIQNLTLLFQAPIGSQRELEDWLVRTFDQLQRTHRIRVITRPGG